MKSYKYVLLVAMVLVSIYFINSNNNIKINSNGDNIEFFEIKEQQLSDEYLKSTEFTEKIYDNIEKNFELNIGYEEIIVINKPVDEIKYIPYQVYLTEDSCNVEKISSYYGITDKSESEREGKFYIEEYSIENSKETHFVNSYNSILYLSSHQPNVKIYFVKINNKYLVFSIKA